MTASIIRLIIIEDHTLLLQGYQNMLADVEDIRIVATAANYYDAISTLRTNPCDVLLLDLSMPLRFKNGESRLSGLDLLEHVRKENLTLDSLVISTHRDYEIIKNTMTLGAKGYVFKNIDYPELLEAIRCVATHKKYLQKEVESIIESKMQDESRFIEEGIRLTPREKEILKLLGDGMSAEKIAEHLGLVRYTIEEYRKKLIKKFRAKNTTNLIKKACDYKYI
ncbi:response regulator transcription factor [Persicitalea jodogahamensis]|uniref:DNA-binding response regulator n=1 Tax=Persicitalea jodogahamensis TaxID=402147 RepID=A0A8J3DEE9_9BACT|nr:response regulator transcription factor [Persicitalea jodogahamensis]GHB88878.1 DNA-binding response regulator [Persicitalea jodogahamensis]